MIRHKRRRDRILIILFKPTRTGYLLLHHHLLVTMTRLLLLASLSISLSPRGVEAFMPSMKGRTIPSSLRYVWIGSLMNDHACECLYECCSCLVMPSRSIWPLSTPLPQSLLSSSSPVVTMTRSRTRGNPPLRAAEGGDSSSATSSSSEDNQVSSKRQTMVCKRCPSHNLTCTQSSPIAHRVVARALIGLQDYGHKKVVNS